MSSRPHNEQVIKTSVELLSLLVRPTDKYEDERAVAISDFDDVLSVRLSSKNFVNVYENLLKLITIDEKLTWPIHNAKDRSRWKFIRTSLRLMRVIHDIFVESVDEREKLLSISQKKVLEASFEFVISLGILQNLLPGVGVSLDCRSKHIRKIPTENLSEFAKYRRLCLVMDDLCYLFDVDIFHDLIVAKHLEDVLAGLFQLSFAPLKKPCDCKDKDTIDLNSLDDDFEIKEMNFSMWKKLEENRKKYNDYLTNLLQKIYKPLLIRKFSLLLNSKNIPRWMKQRLTKFLSDTLKENNGVTVMIKALLDSESMTPDQSSACVSVAKLISHECLNDNVFIAPQLLKILKSERKLPYDLVFILVATLAINFIHSHDPGFAEKYIFHEIYKPLKILKLSAEDELCDAVQQLYNLFVIPTNNTLSLPIRLLLPCCRILFHMHCRIKDTVCYLKSYVKELLMKLLCEITGPSFDHVMNCFIFNAETNDIYRMPSEKNFSLSASGGIRFVDSKEDLLDMESATLLLDLVKGIPENEKVVRSLFVFSLKTFIDQNRDEKFAQKRLVIIILLTEVSQCPTTLKHILKDSENIINFVGDLLRTNVDSTEHDDIICVGLTFLTMVLYDVKKKKNVRWSIFNALVPIVERFKQHSTPEVKFLAEEVCNLIRTHGVIGNVQSPSDEFKRSLIEEIVQSDCERCIEEACDPLLPVRAHALMELISLIKKGNPETLAKKEKIYCLFEENLKDQDSFLYLRAIEGLSYMATLKPDDVLPLLCQEFISCSTSTTQLKIGEVLVRTTKLLNDFVHPHKKLLVCTFMNGVKSEDSLIRASSLSNLAEICLMLERSIIDMLYEVLSCALNIAQYDKDVEPRRAAVLLVSGLFRGLKTSIFTFLDTHLVDLYHTLKRIHSTDADEVVRIQAALSLEILNDSTRQFISSKPTFEKKINIIRPL